MPNIAATRLREILFVKQSIIKRKNRGLDVCTTQVSSLTTDLGRFSSSPNRPAQKQANYMFKTVLLQNLLPSAN